MNQQGLHLLLAESIQAVSKAARMCLFLHIPTLSPPRDTALCGAETSLDSQSWHEMSILQTISDMHELILIHLKVYADPVIHKSISHPAPHVCPEPLEQHRAICCFNGGLISRKIQHPVSKLICLHPCWANFFGIFILGKSWISTKINNARAYLEIEPACAVFRAIKSDLLSLVISGEGFAIFLSWSCRCVWGLSGIVSFWGRKNMQKRFNES